MSDFYIEGAEELSQRLLKLAQGLGRKEAVRILRKGAPPVKREMKKLVPQRTGRLHKSIATRRGKKRRDVGETIIIGPRGGKNGAPYAHIVELGSRGGKYTAKRGAFSVYVQGGGNIRVKEIQRKGVRGVGFIQRAFENTKSEVEQRIAKEIKNLVES